MDSPSVSFPTLYEWHARLLERTAGAIAFWISKMPQERLTWCPEGESGCTGRSTLDQVWECITVNHAFRAYLSGSQPGERTESPLKDAQDASSQLLESAKALADVIRSLDEGALARTYNIFIGPVPGAILLELPLNNMNYHGGQINYIQVLYGDKEFGVPPTFAEFWSGAQG